MTVDGPPDPAAEESPLGDLVVVDLTRALAGPHAAMMLGDLGARVIKVESPHGDDSRTWGPPFVEAGGVRESTYFMSANRNKESIRLDLKEAGDLALLERLVARADVLLENFRVGVLERLGLDPRRLHEINPRLVIGSITGFGHDGPEADRAGYDQIAQGEGGLMSLTGETPTKIGVPIADLLAGMNLAYGVVAALHERHRTGRGRVVRTSLLASAVGVHAYLGTMWTVGGVRPTPTGVHHPSIAPYGMYRTRSAPVQIACASERLWLALAGLLGLDPTDPRFVTNLDRVTHRDELTGLIESSLVVHPAEHWLARLDDLGVPAGKVRAVDDVYAWEQTRSQGLLMEVPHPALGSLPLPGSPLRLDDNAWSGGRREHLHPPMLGEHDDDVRAWLESDRG
jgi:crotonobetainyl-CoA:carnitine CoA-transferase CaiB-like acyl-CoA transferase